MVIINGSSSSWAPVTSGVPQRTVLGPLLFLIYINDIAVDIKSTIRLFADDCVLYREIKSHNDSNLLQQDLDTLCRWAYKWQMRFNVSKCHIMYMTRKKSPLSSTYIYNESPKLNCS